MMKKNLPRTITILRAKIAGAHKIGVRVLESQNGIEVLKDGRITRIINYKDGNDLVKILKNILEEGE